MLCPVCYTKMNLEDDIYECPKCHNEIEKPTRKENSFEY